MPAWDDIQEQPESTSVSIQIRNTDEQPLEEIVDDKKKKKK